MMLAQFSSSRRPQAPTRSVPTSIPVGDAWRRRVTAVYAVAGFGVALSAIPARVAGAQGASETALVVTLEQALARVASTDPTLVAAAGQLSSATWAQRAARAALVLPSVSITSDATAFSAPAMNIGTLQPATRVVTSQVQASYDLYLGRRQLAQVRRASAGVASAEAAETQARFAVARATTADYYNVVSARELYAVAVDRVQRAEEQLAIARARVRLGVVVPTDSLQIALELTRAKLERIDRDAVLRVTRLQLGHRVGLAAPVDAAPADAGTPPELPLTAADAIERAVRGGPAYEAARAEERASGAAYAVERSAYFPKVTVSAAAGGFDDQFLPRSAYRSQISVAVSLPVWDNGARELAVVQARAAREAAASRRRDLEIGAAQTVTAAYTGYATARAGIELAATGVTVARETYRVQDARYRAGAITVLDVLEAQGALTRAESDLVHARQRARLALADLESILGQRLTTPENHQGNSHD